MPSTQSTSMLAFAARWYWMMLGPLILGLLAFSIITNGNGWLTRADIAFLVLLGVLLMSRWLEFHEGNPETATGEPATTNHLRRYLLYATLLGLSGWVLANLMGNYWLAR